MKVRGPHMYIVWSVNSATGNKQQLQVAGIFGTSESESQNKLEAIRIFGAITMYRPRDKIVKIVGQIENKCMWATTSYYCRLTSPSH